MVKLLLDRGADVRAKVKDGATPLRWPAQTGDLDVVKLLLDQGADANEKGHNDFTVLMWAAEKGFLEEAKLLVERGADVNAKDIKGRNGTHVGCHKRSRWHGQTASG